jgi:threonine dehydrogenase-like Zn-dependent dehydrogenase
MRTVLDFGKGRFKVKEIEEVRSLEDEVLIEVKACGLCGSEKGKLEEIPEGTHIGHEIAGIIENAGNSKILKKGDRIVLNVVSGCGVCKYCKNGMESYCIALSKGKSFHPHGFSEKIAYIDRNCLKIPDSMSFETAIAVGGCGIGVAYHGIKRLDVIENQSICVLGVGPIGLAAVMILKYLKAKPIALDISDYRLNLAKELGAEKVFNLSKEKDVFVKFSQENKIERSVLCTVNHDAVNLGLSCLVPQGKMLILAGVSNFAFESWSLIGRGDKSIIGSWHYHRSEWQEILDMITNGLPAHELITHTFSFNEVEKAFKEFLKGDTGKVVLKP